MFEHVQGNDHVELRSIKRDSAHLAVDQAAAAGMTARAGFERLQMTLDTHDLIDQVTCGLEEIA